MDQHSRERRLAADFTDKTVFVGCVSWRDLYDRSFSLFSDRADPEVLLQRSLAPLVYHPCGSPDLGIIISSDVVHEKIDEATFVLKYGEKVNDFSGGPISGCKDWLRFG